MKAYQVRFLDEYQKLCDKYIKLLRMLKKVDLGTIEFKLNCPVELLKEQADIMSRYINILLKRDEYEKVGLPHYDFDEEYANGYGKY